MKHRVLMAIIPILAVAASASAGQTGLDFAYYAGYQQTSSDPLAGFSLSVDTNESNGTVDFTFTMDAMAGNGSIRSIWFEDGAELEDVIGMSSTGRVDMRTHRGRRDPARAHSSLDWEGTEERFSRKGSRENGIGAGESLTISFEADDEFFSEGIEALMSGESRIVIKLEGLGGHSNRYAYFTSTGGSEFLQAVPLPTTGLMAGLVLMGGAGCGRRR